VGTRIFASLSKARATSVRRLSAIPFAIFEMVFAVAGATTSTSVVLESSVCGIQPFLTSIQSWYTEQFPTAENTTGEIILVASGVITT